jgi:hypothetical protein
VSATGRSRPRARHTGRHTPQGLVNSDGELTAAGEHWAEDQAAIRLGYWDPPAEFDDPGPDGMGWAPDPFPGGSIV